MIAFSHMAQDLGGQPQKTVGQRSRALLSALLPIHSEQLGLPIVVQEKGTLWVKFISSVCQH